jgi:hypothetical protein
MDRLLERTARARGGARPPGDCLDAETMAAWMDGTLTATERAAVETHTAGCDRCLAVLAAIVTTAPPASERSPASWLPVRWVVPLTSAAVAMIAWVLIQGPPGSQSPVPPPAPPPMDAATAAEPTMRLERDPASQAPADALEKKREAPAASAPFKDQPESRRSAESLGKSVSPPPPAAASKPAPSPSRTEARDRLQTMARAAAPPAREIRSPDPDVRWRFAGTSVERSTDGGRTWQPQSTGTIPEVLAGSSPAPAVCWIVGRSGLVLLTEDAQVWRRLSFPDLAVDLVSVTARDAREATVTAADGRTYRTGDAGRTWAVQENPAAPF